MVKEVINALKQIVLHKRMYWNVMEWSRWPQKLNNLKILFTKLRPALDKQCEL